MSFFNLAGRVLDKRLDAAASKAADTPGRVDTGLPFKAYIGAVVDLPLVDFALLDGSLVTTPSENTLVKAASRIRLEADESIPLYRLYTELGSHDGHGQSFIQVLGNGDDISEVIVYQHLLRDVPTTTEDQEMYTGAEGGLGMLTFDLADDYLSAAGVSAQQIAALFAGADCLTYRRDTPVDHEFVPPYYAKETRIDDAIGEKGLEKEIWFMPYIRDLPDGKQERLLITFEHVMTKNGVAHEEVYVDFLVGYAIPKQKVTVR